ncbi:hypothetical protein C1I97_04265 [Streptomyces sp. NTH33]|nr:hypothetical protein C1I97_04265 [Streptomyces sp. NTH33]
MPTRHPTAGARRPASRSRTSPPCWTPPTSSPAVGRVRELAPHGVDAALDAASADGLRAAVELVKDKDRVGTITSVEAYERLGARWIGSQRSAKRLDALVSLHAQGTLRIHVRATYRLGEAAQAHRDVESGHGRGKVVLLIG